MTHFSEYSQKRRTYLMLSHPITFSRSYTSHPVPELHMDERQVSKGHSLTN